eukprot:COSAG04_NODE_6451_length_1323_cov_1.563725_1_plen_42_part_10
MAATSTTSDALRNRSALDISAVFACTTDSRLAAHAQSFLPQI